MSAENGFEAAFARACRGSDDDREQLLREYGAYIQRIVRTRLEAQLRPTFESLDFIRLCRASFFAEPVALKRFHDAKKFLQYLTVMTYHKVNDERRHSSN